MSGGMAFRKDCEDCGRSFLTPDKKAKICQRCAGKGQPRPQSETVPQKGLSPKAARKTKLSIVKSQASGPIDSPRSEVSREIESQGSEEKVPPAPKEKTGKQGEPPTPDRKREEIELTPAQIQEIVDRYQIYVQGLERPAHGRRKTIAADMGIPSRSVVLALRQWNQQQSQVEELTREERFTIEKAYFSRLEGKNSFSEIQDQIVQETGLNLWVVSRYLDLLHDGEKVQNVFNVSSEQETAILNEYRKYLSASGPPSSALHPLIAERTGVLPKQVYRVLLSYRLSRFREKWG